MNTIERRAVLAGMAGVPAALMLGGMAPLQDKTAGSSVNEMKNVSVTKKPQMYGVVYDVGLNYAGNEFSVEPFDPKLVEYDIKTIANSLHANAIRIEGEAIDRLVIASRLAHKQGLTVLFNPWKMNADAAELKPYYIEAAKAAEMLRAEGIDVIYLAGCEYTIFQQGILPGDTLVKRLAGITSFFAGTDAAENMRKGSAKVNQILSELVSEIRQHFKGRISYASLPFEQIDWQIFDVVAVDYYRNGESAEKYIDGLKNYRVAGKPLLIVEVGSCTYEGAAKLGGGGFMVLQGTNPDGSMIFKDGAAPKRSETEQADYIETQVKLLANNNTDGVFVFVYNQANYPHGKGNKDLDMVSYALVATYPKDDPRSKQMPPWQPKEAFYRLGKVYGEIGKIRG